MMMKKTKKKITKSLSTLNSEKNFSSPSAFFFFHHLLRLLRACAFLMESPFLLSMNRMNQLKNKNIFSSVFSIPLAFLMLKSVFVFSTCLLLSLSLSLSRSPSSASCLMIIFIFLFLLRAAPLCVHIPRGLNRSVADDVKWLLMLETNLI